MGWPRPPRAKPFHSKLALLCFQTVGLSTRPLNICLMLGRPMLSNLSRLQFKLRAGPGPEQKPHRARLD
eukprot:10207658-Alexandrium_andersonii.AAC.1